jgi:hypothetical protein
MRAVTAAAVTIAVRWPTAATSSWLSPAKMCPGNTSTSRPTAARTRASRLPQASAITTAVTTTYDGPTSGRNLSAAGSWPSSIR